MPGHPQEKPAVALRSGHTADCSLHLMINSAAQVRLAASHAHSTQALTPCAAPLLLGSGIPPPTAAPPAMDAVTACSRPTLLTVSSALLLLTVPSLFVTWQW